MLEPRDSEIWVLFLVFVVLPLISYFLLGKLSETRKRKVRISSIATCTAEETSLVEDRDVDSAIPIVSVSNNQIHNCARCSGTATTRCSQCKSVWYCSGRCQVSHWRQVHKLECQLSRNKSSQSISLEGSCVRETHNKTKDSNMFESSVKHPSLEKSCSTDVISLVLNPLSYTNDSGLIMNTSGKHFVNRFVNKIPCAIVNGDGYQENTFHESSMVERQSENASDDVCNDWMLKSSTFGINETRASGIHIKAISLECQSRKAITHCNEIKGLVPERTSNRSSKARTAAACAVTPPKSENLGMKTSKDDTSESSLTTIKDNIHLQGSTKVSSLGITRMMGLMRSVKPDHEHLAKEDAKKKLKVKMLFPYEEFLKCCQLDIVNVSPRGLVNCGNSCYANAVLQCLTFTKPLIIYLIRQSHSRNGCSKNWCLLCELERHAMMLRDTGYPLSPVKILTHIRSLNSHIGDGSQEDAHEFLRLIIASMQSICLETPGGERVVDPRLQDTTFVQHTFGGCLSSKVKCLRCEQESVRHENMMDLTLEIFGWVESLEDALTQFTSSEELDGENMYRCGRCASYVRARKQLSIKEAPNILTIVLKRFQEGSYGKINKRIIFPEILDMIPFMTGTDDIPPPYVLYAVVVHLNTSNESFSGHYISYVKDLKGNWFKVDDTQVLPVQVSQVMSEGAYILFYSRSHPRPARGNGRKASSQRSQSISDQYDSSPLKSERCSKSEPSKLNHNLVRVDPYLDHRIEWADGSRAYLVKEGRSRPSSDRSLFTSSDDSSFTTESTRDSFSTLDYSDTFPFSSIFQALHPAESSASRDIMSPCG